MAAVVELRLLPSSEPTLARKEIAAHFGRDRKTVGRWERDGLRLVDGRATASEVAWFLAQRAIARRIGIPPHDFLSMDPSERGVALILAHNLGRACVRSAAAGRRSIAEIAMFLSGEMSHFAPPPRATKRASGA